ncbi:MAG: S24 family peptidase [Prevotella sp.]|nr:S24 family peptidase [Prevotella sp.]
MAEEFFCLPKSVLGNYPIVDWPAHGDSMVDANIDEGDILRVELGAIPHDGEIVMVSIDNEYTAKVYFTDQSGDCWLCPRNSRYDCILLTGLANVIIVGIVKGIIKRAPLQSFRECKAIVDATLSRRQQKGSLMERVAKAVGEGAHLFWAASSWTVVYGVMRDCYGYEGSVSEFERAASTMPLPAGFEYGCGLGKVQRTISNHPYMRHHVDRWQEMGASMREVVLMEFLMKNIG